MHKKTFIYAVILLLLFNVFFSVFALSVNADAPAPPDDKKDCPPSYVGQTKYFYYTPDGDFKKCDDGKEKKVEKKSKTPKRKVRIPTNPRSVATEALITGMLLMPEVRTVHDYVHESWREMDEYWYDEIYSKSYTEVFEEKILDYADFFYDTFLKKSEQIYGGPMSTLTDTPEIIQKTKEINLETPIIAITPPIYLTSDLDYTGYFSMVRYVTVINDPDSKYPYELREISMYAPYAPGSYKRYPVVNVDSSRLGTYGAKAETA